jgi:hypothetical protein
MISSSEVLDSPLTSHTFRYLMQDEIAALERRRQELLEQVAKIGHFRSGSVTALVRPCGKRGCRCSEPGDPGHGPNLRLTYKMNGKSRSESLPTAASIRRARREIAEFRKFQQWHREFVEVNARICRLMEVGRDSESAVS